MPQISVHSIDDPRLASYRALNERNLTRHSGLFIAEGDKVTERLIASRYPVASLLAQADRAERLESQLPPETPIYVAEQKLLEATIGFNFHRGVVGCGRRLPSPTIDDVTRQTAPQSTILVCPDVHDPTNLGSMIRTAVAFGCAGIVLGSQCADPFSRRVLRVSMGAALQLPIVESRSLATDLESLQQADFTLAATVIDPSAEPLAAFRRPKKLALLLGSEGHGLGSQWLSRCHRRITIPMQLGIDSLNVAVAAAVFLYHCTRDSSRGA